MLDLDPKLLTMPQVPNPFSPFLEKEPKNKLMTLELKRNRIQHMIKMLQSDLEKINQKLVILNKQKKGEYGPLSFEEQGKKET